MQTLLSVPFVRVYLYPGPSPVLETHWLGFATSAEFRAAIEQARELGLHHRVKGWVANDQLLGAVRPRDLEWVHTDLLLPLSQAGLQRFAIAESAETLNRLTISGMYERAAPTVSFEVQRFDDVERARAWASGAE